MFTCRPTSEEGNQVFKETVECYFQNTPDICGFQTHLILLHTPLCVRCRLTSFGYIFGKLVDSLFVSPDSSPDFYIVTSHNVGEFRVPFVAVLVHGKSRHSFCVRVRARVCVCMCVCRLLATRTCIDQRNYEHTCKVVIKFHVNLTL